MLPWNQRQRRLFLLFLGALVLALFWIRARWRTNSVQDADQLPAKGVQRPVYLFIAGIEGAGHDTIREVLKVCAKLEVTNPTIHLDGGEEPEHRYAKFFAESLELALQDRHLLAARGADMVILDAKSTFPMGPEREPTRRPDLEVLLDLHRKERIELRMLVLWREPLRCVQHIASRMKNRDPLFAARVVEESLLYLSKQLENLPAEFWTILRYDDFVANPSRYASALTSLLPETAKCHPLKLDARRVRELHRLYDARTLSMQEIGEQQCRLPEELCRNLDTVLGEFLDKRAFLWAPLAELATQ